MFLLSSASHACLCVVLQLKLSTILWGSVKRQPKVLPHCRSKVVTEGGIVEGLSEPCHLLREQNVRLPQSRYRQPKAPASRSASRSSPRTTELGQPGWLTSSASRTADIHLCAGV